MPSLQQIADAAIFLIRNHSYSVLEACLACATPGDDFKAIHSEIMSRYYV